MIDFFQIYYKETQLSELYDFATPHFNETLTPYFENSVIAELVPKSTADLIGVCSWRLRKKRGDSQRYLQGELTKEKILAQPFDVAVLTPRATTHKVLLNASHWHGKAWDDAFIVLKGFLKRDLGIKVPDELSVAIYENHFIAKGEIYRSYVSECLTPTIRFIQNEGVFSADSGYLQKKKWDQEAIKDYQMKSWRLDWPIAPFILERLFSIWIEGRGYKLVNL